MRKNYKILITIFLLIFTTDAFTQDESFDLWFNSFKKHALKNGISEKELNNFVKYEAN